jgi:hypothetical protein
LFISTEKFRKARRLAADPGVDVLMNRFNTTQRKRAREVFTDAAKTGTPIVAFTATRFRTLNRSKRGAPTTPGGESRRERC